MSKHISHANFLHCGSSLTHRVQEYKLLTRWLQMPDRALSLIGLHGASISLIGQDYGISERGEMTEECWNWKKMKSCIVHTSLCVDWHVCRGGGGRWSEQLSSENKTSSVELWFWGLLGIGLLASFFKVDSSRYTLCSKYIFKAKIVLCVQHGFMRAVVSLRCCVSNFTCEVSKYMHLNAA